MIRSDTQSFQEELAARTSACNDAICSFLPDSLTEVKPYFYSDAEAVSHTVEEAMNYSVRVGGKRLRPMIMELSFELCGGTNKELLHPFMAAIEFIHNYSLVHDDLPAMDNDELRRGNLTTHAKYGEAIGILAGDALLNFAFETALKASESCSDSKELMSVVLALRILAAKAGYHGMIGGQCIDIESEQKSFSAEEAEGRVFYIHENKTAALLEAAFMCGAILAGADVEMVDSLEKAASLIGHAFQIRDDILDETGAFSKSRGTVAKDKEAGKLSFVTVYGLEESEARVDLYTKQALEILKDAGAGEDTFIYQLATYLMKRDF